MIPSEIIILSTPLLLHFKTVLDTQKVCVLWQSLKLAQHGFYQVESFHEMLARFRSGKHHFSAIED